MFSDVLPTDDEEDEMSFDDADSFDASLEDTDKTPVVLPEDWRHASPDNADRDLYDDVYEGRETSPGAGAQPNGPMSGSRGTTDSTTTISHLSKTCSMTSVGTVLERSFSLNWTTCQRASRRSWTNVSF